MFISMILVLMNAHPKPRAALLHPGRRFAAVCLDQASNIADALAFGNDPRLSENPGGQLRNCRHSLSELLTACFYLSVGENTINANARKAHRSAAGASESLASCRRGGLCLPTLSLRLSLSPFLTLTSGRRLFWWGMGNDRPGRDRVRGRDL